MSFDVDDGIKEHHERMSSLQAIRTFDSGAYWSGSQWVSGKLGPRDCDEVEVVNGDRGPVIRFYKSFEKIRLYPASFGASDFMNSVLRKLKSSDPEKFRKLVETFRSGEFQFE